MRPLWFPRLHQSLYGPAMADERDRQFASDLTRMSEEEVREQLEASVQPVPFLRAMAGTELEKRRQQRTDALLRPGLSLGTVAVSIALLCGVGAAVAAWYWWGDYLG